MKTLLLFFTTVLFTALASAQTTIYDINFDTDEPEGWVFIDNDGNDQNWSIKNNDASIILGQAEFDVLSSSQLGGSIFDNWAILPVQDLSEYTNVTLSFKYLKGLFECENLDNLDIYAATSPEIAELLANGIVATVALEGDNQLEPAVEVLKTVEIPEIYNVPGIYFAIVHQAAEGDPFSFNWAVEITELSLSSIPLGTTDFATHKSSVVLKNPVNDDLELKLGSQFLPQSSSIVIYDARGVRVLEKLLSGTTVAVDNLPAGFYTAAISNDNWTEKLKFIKN